MENIYKYTNSSLKWLVLDWYKNQLIILHITGDCQMYIYCKNRKYIIESYGKQMPDSPTFKEFAKINEVINYLRKEEKR